VAPKLDRPPGESRASGRDEQRLRSGAPVPGPGAGRAFGNVPHL